MSSSNSGYTLLEMTVALLLASLLMTLVAKTMHSYGTQSRSMLRSLEQEVSVLRATSILSAALSQHDALRLALNVRVSTSADLTLSDGRLHPFIQTRGTSAPRPSSTIVSVLEPSLPHRARISFSSSSELNSRIDACFESPTPLDTTTIRSYLAIGPWGARQLVGTITRSNQTCVTLNGRSIPSLFTEGGNQPGALLLLYPVKREYSVFVDKSGTLRYLGHVGGRVLESQPIVKGLRSIHSRKMHLGAQVWGQEMQVQASGGLPTSWVEMPLFTQQGVWMSSLL